MRPSIPEHLIESYDEFPRIEQEFQAALDESLHPRSPDMLYDMVRDLRLPQGAAVVDLGCGEGTHAVRLAQQFGLSVLGVDPVPRHIELAVAARERAAKEQPELRALLRFEAGAADAIPAADGSVDLIWCREVLYIVEALDAALAECRRVLRPGGRMLVYQHVAGDALEPRELERHWTGLGIVTANADARLLEKAFSTAGFQMDECLDLGSEFGEHSQEQRGEPGRRLLHAARLLRDPNRYIAKFGRANYDIMLADCFWHIHRMIGKLDSRIYLLRKPG